MDKFEEIMKRLSKTTLDYKFVAIVNVNGETYWLDSCETMDCGYELMVFPVFKHFDNAVEKHFNYDKNTGEISLFTRDFNENSLCRDLYFSRYDTIEEAEKEFDFLVANPDELYKRIDKMRWVEARNEFLTTRE